MKTYELHSGSFGGLVRITFNAFGILANYEVVNQELNQVSSAETRIPITEQKFRELAAQYGFTYMEVDLNITFEMFYDRYAYKVDKQPALKKWNKLSKEHQSAAYKYIPIYDAQIKRDNVRRKYPSTYLESQIYL